MGIIIGTILTLAAGYVLYQTEPVAAVVITVSIVAFWLFLFGSETN